MQQVTYSLSIDKPTGGTIQAVGGIECGLMGSTCAAESHGMPCRYCAKPDTGFTLQNFTGDCAADGRLG